MNLGRYGVFTFSDALAPAQLAELAERVEALGYSTLWYPEALKYEPFAIGSWLLGHTKTLVVGSGIANIYARDAMAAVMGANSLNEFYDGRFVLGLGVSHAPLVSDFRGHDYGKPMSAMRGYLDAMDQAWEGLGGAPETKQVVLAALGPKMSQLAAERTLGAFPYNVTPEHARLAREAMGTQGTLICEQKVCVSEDPDKARAAARASLGFYLELPNYYRNWFRLGFDESDLENGGSDRLMDAMVLWGSVESIRERLESYFENGADHVVVQPIRADGEQGPDYDALEALAPAG